VQPDGIDFKIIFKVSSADLVGIICLRMVDVSAAGGRVFSATARKVSQPGGTVGVVSSQ